jgi:hypothetical protein
MRRWKLWALLVVVLAALAGGAAWWWWLQPPALVQALRTLPEVRDVEYRGPASASRVVLQLRDWPFVSREQCEADGVDFNGHLNTVEKVQTDQLAIARWLMRDQGVRDLYLEGVTTETLADWQLRLETLKLLDEALRDLADEATKQTQRESTLEVGTAGRLLLAGEIAGVKPLDDAAALKAAKPAGEDKKAPDAAKIEARRKAMLAQLPKTGLAVIVLGGTHDLRPYLDADTLYIRVTPRSYPGK